MHSFMFGLAASGHVWFSTDFMRTFGMVFWSAMTAVAIYPVRRDAKRLADAVASSQITYQMTLTLAKWSGKLLKSGGRGRTRTCDLLRVKQAL
jgi:hypothetical protein